MPVELTCPKCGTVLLSDALEGLCPKCVGRFAFVNGEPVNAPDDRVEVIFNAALALSDPTAREAFISAACPSNIALAARLRRLLEMHDGAGDFLKTGAPLSPDIERELARLKPEEAGDQIGPYKLMEQIGRGGFGTVWVADQERPMRRRVALKIIKMGMDTKEVIARFEQERQALAMMDHPHIAKVLDAGATQWGRPYFVMELVRGIKITDYCDQANLPTAERLALFIQICNAVQHAHQKGIIHRDLKPSNILVTLHDGVPIPKVIDFGVAKATQQQRLTDLTIYTQFQQMLGTPLYMSPEQAEMSGLDVDTRSDIYSLGVLLYELLVGRTPFDPETLMRAGLDEIRRVIREQEPPKPSTALQTMAADVRANVALHRQSDGAKMAGLLRGDLDWIVMKALEKDRTRRYATANGFAQDIRRYLANEPVAAVAPSAAYLFRKFARRHKTAFGVTSVIAVVLMVATGVSIWQAKLAITAKHETTAALGEVEKKKNEVDRKNTEQRAMLAEAARSDRLVAEEKLRAGLGRDAFAHLARACEYDPRSTFAAEKAAVALNARRHTVPTAILAGHEGDVRSAQFSPDGTRIVTASRDKTARVWDAATGRCLATLAGHGDGIENVQFSPDGTRIVTVSVDKTARVWDAATGESLATLEGHEDGVYDAQFSPDGMRIVTRSRDKTARVWDAVTGKNFAILAAHEDWVRSAQFSPDGTRIVTASVDKTARVWDAATGKSLITLAGHEDAVLSAQFSPDGTRIVTASGDKTARVWDATTGKGLAILAGHEDRIRSAQFSPDGTRIVTASWDKTARVWDVATGKSLAILAGHEDAVLSAQFSPDGTCIVTASVDKTARVWGAATGKSLAILAGHEDAVNDAQFSAVGTRIVTASGDKTARVWDAVTDKSLATLAGHEDGVNDAQFSADSTRIVTASGDKTARVWDAATGQSLATLAGHEDGVNDAQFSADGTRIVTASGDKTARVWDAATGKSLATLVGHEDGVNDAQFSVDGTRIVTASGDTTAWVWDAATGKSLAALVGHKGRVWSAQFSPDGTRIVTASGDTTAWVWDAATGKSLAALVGHKGRVWSAQFSPDGTRIVTASRDETARVWDATTGKDLAALAGHEDRVWNAQFSPDGTRIVTASKDKTARVWDAATGKSLAILTGHENEVLSAQFSPDGTRIVTASKDKTARVWDAATGKSLAILTGHENEVLGAQFSPDGTRIVTASSDKTAHIWTILPPGAGPPPEWFADFLRYVAQRRLNPDGELETLKPDDWLALRERMRTVRRASVGTDTPYLRILRRFAPQ